MACQEEFAVESISSHRLDKATLQTQFRVKWVGYQEPSWEPIDNVFKCPKLITDMIGRKTAEHAKSLAKLEVSAEALANHPRFPVLDRATCSKFNDPIEFIPNGNEHLHWIIDERLSDKGNLIWKVLFKENVKAPRFVRKAVVCYYWPLEAALFLTDWVKKKERRDGRLSEVSKK